MIEELSLECHYKVTFNTSDYSYGFKTSGGAEYSVLFVDASSVFFNTRLEGSYCYNIVISKIKSGDGLKDKGVKETIGAIVDHYFSDPERILIFTCEEEDGKQSVRKKLFDMWFSNGTLSHLVKFNEDIEGSEATYHSSILFHKENPLGISEVIKSYQETVKILGQTK